MPASSRSQQRLFGMVHACQKSGKCASPEVEKIAKGISAKDAEEFARTKHDGLPERKVKKKHKKHKLKSFHEFTEQQMLEGLNTQARKMASLTMGDPVQIRQQAAQAGVNVNKYFRIMSKWLEEIEQKMNLKGTQSGEEANNWHERAVQILQSVLNQVDGGKRQWQLSQQLRAAQGQRKVPQPQAAAPQQQATPHQGMNPTPLEDIG
jgi:hypothetical protein